MPSHFYDLSGRAKFRVCGEDRVRFLNGQTTNDIRRASSAVVQETCVLNAKGHFDAHLFLFAADDAIYLDASASLRAALPCRLDRYIIADDVTVMDMSGSFALFHVLGHEQPLLAGAIFCLQNSRLAHAGWDLWVPSAQAASSRQELSETHSSVSEEEWETMRIELGRPRWGHELTPAILPPEANLEERAIDYRKGCYIGQEVISRMKMSGQRSKRLCGLAAASGTEIATGAKLAAADGKEVGWVTSSTFSARLGRNLALGYVKRGFNDAGTTLRLPDASGLVQVVDLPFPARLDLQG